MSCLYQLPDNGVRYRYASAGGLYPVQTYLHLKAGAVEGVSQGTYYYHSVKHLLMVLSAGAEIDRDVHIPFVNTPTFDQAALSIFFVVQLSAIAPVYGDRSIHFATIEAGLMAHLLETEAAACGIGLCHIGSLDFDRIRHLFRLDSGHLLIHSLVGGAVDWEPSSLVGPSGTSGEGVDLLIADWEEGEV